MPNGSQYQTVQTGYAGPWVDQVLQALGAPTTDSNRAALRAWAASEGTVSSNNPLAFSGTYAGATTCIAQCGSSSPIMAYSSPQQGATNTAAFILGNSSYGSIVQAFRGDAGLQAIWQAINGSPWCSGCQSGSYPTALHAAAGGATGGSAAPPGAPGGVGSFNPSAPVVSFPILGTAINAGQALKIKGWFLMIAGGTVAAVGMAFVLASLGLSTKGGQAAASAIPGVGGQAARLAGGRAPGQARPSQRTQQRRRTELEQQRADTRVRLEQERGSQRRATANERRERTVQGAPRRYIPPAGSRERRERATQPF